MTQPRHYITKKEHAALVLLSMRFEMYPLDMVKLAPELTETTIYIVLANMVERDLVVARHTAESQSLARVAYRITATGRATLLTAHVGGNQRSTDA